MIGYKKTNPDACLPIFRLFFKRQQDVIARDFFIKELGAIAVH